MSVPPKIWPVSLSRPPLWAARRAIGEEVLENEDKDIPVYVINPASGFKIGRQLKPQQPP